MSKNNIFIRKILRIIIIIQMSIILVSCVNVNSKIEREMNEKFIDLYCKVKEAHNIFSYHYDLLTEEMFNKYACVSGIDFDCEGNIWIYRELSPGHHFIDIYSIDGNIYSYLRRWGEYLGGDSNYYGGVEVEYVDGVLADGYYDGYEKYINDVEVQDEYQKINKEGKEIFDRYYANLNFDKKRSWGLKLNCTKVISEFNDNVGIDDYDTLVIGKYNEKNGFYSEPKPVEWLVLYKDKYKALLLSKNILFRDKVDASQEAILFKESSLNKLLNNEFYDNAFSESEKEFISKKNECGYVFLLSDKEISKYLGNNQRKTYSMPILKTEKDADGNDIAIVEQLYDYWLKNNKNSDQSKFINENGEIGFAKNYEIKGIRPAIWLNLK